MRDELRGIAYLFSFPVFDHKIYDGDSSVNKHDVCHSRNLV
jgi:hypothetical protein